MAARRREASARAARCLLVLAAASPSAAGCGADFVGSSTSTSTGGNGGTTSAPTGTGRGGSGTTSTPTGTGGIGGQGTGGQGGSVSGPPCHPVGLEDDFNGPLNSSLWIEQGNGNITYSGDLVTVRLQGSPGTWADLKTQASYDLTGCAVWLEVVSVFDDPTAGQVYFGLWDDVGTSGFACRVRNGDLTCHYEVVSSEVREELIDSPFDAVLHRWWRFRHDGNTTYFETSPDGIAYVSQMDVTDAPFIGQVKIAFGGKLEQEVSAEVNASFDNLNIPPSS